MKYTRHAGYIPRLNMTLLEIAIQKQKELDEAEILSDYIACFEADRRVQITCPRCHGRTAYYLLKTGGRCRFCESDGFVIVSHEASLLYKPETCHDYLYKPEACHD